MTHAIKTIWVTTLLFLCCFRSMAQPALTRIEYYIDSDPGYGKATTVPLGASLPLASFSLNTINLPYGTHVVGIRSKNANGVWSLDNKWVFVRIAPVIESTGPKLKYAEYYINNDPGYGKGTSLNISTASNQSLASFTLNITNFPFGTTVIGMRTEDINGAWSLDNKWLFVKVPPQETRAPEIKRVEYYIDSDYGFGKGTPVTITSAQQLAGISFMIDLTKIKNGDHKVGMRTMDANGAWSLDNEWDFSGGSALPLTLLSFNAQVFKFTEAQLLWSTVTEVNTKDFIIQRSMNGVEFDSIGIVAAAGNSVEQLNYSFVDVKPFAGLNYYRLKMQDLDGHSTYSYVIPLRIDIGDNKNLSVYPNPATSVATVSFVATVAGNYTLQLKDISGREVQSVSGASVVGINTVQLNVHNYAAGTYIITLTDKEHGVQSLKLDKF